MTVRSPLEDRHAAAGARFTDFGGWSMPLRYGSELAEHHAVRLAAGIFDLSHMSEVLVTGPDFVSRPAVSADGTQVAWTGVDISTPRSNIRAWATGDR